VSALDYSAIYDPETDVDAHFTTATGAAIATWLRPVDRVLELGCATGLMTAMLAGARRRVVAIERAATYLERARARGLEGVEVRAGDIDALGDIGERFDHVVLANVLHEVADPGAVLAAAATHWLAPHGLVHVSLQNPRSLHRLVAQEMGLLDDLAEVSARGSAYGTQRLWYADELAALGSAAGLAERHREGVVLKPLPIAALADLDPAVLAGLARAGRHVPDHAAMNLLVFAHDR
jgi:2-polyprenyl-3-methyl-5-hydroxy-6-metoxy-1,4-benzoquinol methylase